MLPIRFCYQRRNPEICNTNNQDNEKNHYYLEIYERKGIIFHRITDYEFRLCRKSGYTQLTNSTSRDCTDVYRRTEEHDVITVRFDETL